MSAIVPFTDKDITHFAFWLDYIEPEYLAGLLADLPPTLAEALQTHEKAVQAAQEGV